MIVGALLIGGAYLFARGVLGSDLVRSAIEQQLSARLNQPVRIGAASAAVFPALAINLHDVSIGEPAAVSLQDVRVVTGLRGLLSRRVSDAQVRVSSGTIALPLPFSLPGDAAGSAAPEQESSAFTVESIRVIEFDNIVLTGGGRSLTIDLNASVEGDRLNIAQLEARAAETRLEATGTLDSIARLQGTLDAKAAHLDLDEMMAIGTSFTASDGAGDGSDPDAERTPLHIVINLSAPSGAFTTYTFTDLTTKIDVQPGRVSLSPLAVRAFGGTFEGRLDADATRKVPQLKLSGRASGLDVPALMKAAGSPGGITGQLGGTISLAASGTELDAVMRTARGSIDAAISDGSIPGLDMVRTIVLAFGKPSGAPPEGSGSSFSRLGGTFSVADGTLTSENLAMTSRDFDMTGRGTLHLESGRVEARAEVILSKELTSQAGTDLRRYAQEDGRVIVPATISGTLQSPRVFVDIAAATKRAIGNELKRRAKDFLEGLFKK